MPRSVTIDRGIKSITRGVPGPPGDISVPISSLTFDTENPDLPTTIAQLTWDGEDDTLQFRQNGTTLQIGQEIQWPVVNKTGSTIANGTPVMAVGTTGATGRINIDEMDGTDTGNAKVFLGLATEEITDQSNGKVSTFGKVRDIQTDGGQYSETWIDGDIIYVSPTTIGALTNIKPSVGQLLMPCAFVINSNPSDGVLAVRVTPIDEGLTPTEDEKAAMTGANSPDASNVFATIADVGGGGGGAIEFIAGFTTVGNEQSIVFASLNNDNYILKFDSGNWPAQTTFFSLRINGDANETGYFTTNVVDFASKFDFSNSARVCTWLSGPDAYQATVDIRTNNDLIMRSESAGKDASATSRFDNNITFKDGETNITQVEIVTDDPLPAGVRFKLYKVQTS